jgi:hypothetical protein
LSSMMLVSEELCKAVHLKSNSSCRSADDVR